MNPSLMVTAAALTLAMIFSLYRVFVGPTIFDRLTGLGLISTKTVVLLLVLGFLTGRVDVFVDITLSYALISFVGSLAVAKHFERKGTKPS